MLRPSGIPTPLPAHCFSAVLCPFCAVFPPFFCAVWLPGAKTERTGEKLRKMGEIWGRNGRETAVAEWRWGQAKWELEEALDLWEEEEKERRYKEDPLGIKGVGASLLSCKPPRYRCHLGLHAAFFSTGYRCRQGAPRPRSRPAASPRRYLLRAISMSTCPHSF